MSDDETGEYQPFEAQIYGPDAGLVLGYGRVFNDVQSAMLAGEVEIGTDRRLSSEPNWALFSSTELHAMAVAENDPGQAHGLGRTWNELGNRLGELSRRLLTAAGGMGATWEGRDAVAAGHAVTTTALFAADSGRAAQFMGARVADEAYAAEAARRLMPPPQEVDSFGELGRTLTTDPVPVDVGTAVEVARANKEAQVRVLLGFHSSSVDVDFSTPVFSPPVPVTAAGTAAGVAGGGSGVVGPSAGGWGPGPAAGAGTDISAVSGLPGGPAIGVGSGGPGGVPGSGGVLPGAAGFGGVSGVGPGGVPGPGLGGVPAYGEPGRAPGSRRSGGALGSSGPPGARVPPGTGPAGVAPPLDRVPVTPPAAGIPAMPGSTPSPPQPPLFGERAGGGSPSAGPFGPSVPNPFGTGIGGPDPLLRGGRGGAGGLPGGAGFGTDAEPSPRPRAAAPGTTGSGGTGLPVGQRGPGTVAGGMHPAPFGMGAGAGVGGSREHRRPSYLLEDDDVWAVDVPHCPPIIEPDQP